MLLITRYSPWQEDSVARRGGGALFKSADAALRVVFYLYATVVELAAVLRVETLLLWLA